MPPTSNQCTRHPSMGWKTWFVWVIWMKLASSGTFSSAIENISSMWVSQNRWCLSFMLCYFVTSKCYEYIIFSTFTKTNFIENVHVYNRKLFVLNSSLLLEKFLVVLEFCIVLFLITVMCYPLWLYSLCSFLGLKTNCGGRVSIQTSCHAHDCWLFIGSLWTSVFSSRCFISTWLSGLSLRHQYITTVTARCSFAF